VSSPLRWIAHKGSFVPRVNISPRVGQHILRNNLWLCYDPRRIAFTPPPIVAKLEIDIMAAMPEQSVREGMLNMVSKQMLRDSCLAVLQVRGFA
jgi:hypothetical protein